MPTPVSPPPHTPLGESRWRTSVALPVVVAATVAASILVLAVLPAEYGIDPTGIGARLGLTQMSGKGGGAIVLADGLAGNQNIAQSKVPDAGQPLPLPNPAVHQAHGQAAKSHTLTITLPAFAETEVKTALQANQVVLYAWHTNQGKVYMDYHGHSPDWKDKQAFVRYQEAKEGTDGAQGSLVAPFAGEHGWYWVNLEDHPVVITLSVNGYYDKLVNYGVSTPR